MNTIDGEREARRRLFENMRDQRDLLRSEIDDLRTRLFLARGDVETIRAEERQEASHARAEIFTDLELCLSPEGTTRIRGLTQDEVEQIFRMPSVRRALLKIRAQREVQLQPPTQEQQP